MELSSVKHATFAKRKSSIYRGQPAFALFGIGPYSFAPYKVAISGLHKVPKFRRRPAAGRPVMLDDTCYFLPCPSAVEAAFLLALCNDPITLGLIGSICFRDANARLRKNCCNAWISWPYSSGPTASRCWPAQKPRSTTSWARSSRSNGRRCGKNGTPVSSDDRRGHRRPG